MNSITVGLVQMTPVLGNVATNIQNHIEYVENAAQQGVELLVFPELSLTGYILQDMTYEVATTTDSETFRPLLEASAKHSMDMMVGFVDVDVRGRFYIAAAYISKGTVLHVHHKIYLPTYGMFDEGRYFAPGQSIRAFDTPFGRIGMLICEDFWHMSPAYLLWLDGADILVFHSASPGRGVDDRENIGSARWVQLVNQSYGSMFTNYVIHTNRTGFENGYNFWGGSSIVDPNGDFLVKGSYFEEGLLIHTIDLNQIRRTRSRLPLLRDERTDLLLRELQRVLDKKD